MVKPGFDVTFLRFGFGLAKRSKFKVTPLQIATGRVADLHPVCSVIAICKSIVFYFQAPTWPRFDREVHRMNLLAAETDLIHEGCSLFACSSGGRTHKNRATQSKTLALQSCAPAPPGGFASARQEPS